MRKYGRRGFGNPYLYPTFGNYYPYGGYNRLEQIAPEEAPENYCYTRTHFYPFISIRTNYNGYAIYANANNNDCLYKFAIFSEFADRPHKLILQNNWMTELTGGFAEIKFDVNFKLRIGKKYFLGVWRNKSDVMFGPSYRLIRTIDNKYFYMFFSDLNNYNDKAMNLLTLDYNNGIVFCLY